MFSSNLVFLTKPEQTTSVRRRHAALVLENVDSSTSLRESLPIDAFSCLAMMMRFYPE